MPGDDKDPGVRGRTLPAAAPGTPEKSRAGRSGRCRPRPSTSILSLVVSMNLDCRDSVVPSRRAPFHGFESLTWPSGDFCGASPARGSPHQLSCLVCETWMAAGPQAGAGRHWRPMDQGIERSARPGRHRRRADCRVMPGLAESGIIGTKPFRVDPLDRGWLLIDGFDAPGPALARAGPQR